MRATLLLLVLAACDAGKKPEPDPSQRGDHDVVSEWNAPPEAGVARSDAALAAPIVDAAAAIEATTVASGDIGITWVVYPPSVPLRGDPQFLQQPVIIEVADGGKTTAKKLAPQFGALQPYNQSACKGDAYPLQKREVAKLTFYEGGAGGFLVRREANALVVYTWAQTDGLCGSVDKPVECPRNVKEVTSVAVTAKPGAKVVESIVEIDEKGVRKPFDCGAR